jgi:hypothetical protein
MRQRNTDGDCTRKLRNQFSALLQYCIAGPRKVGNAKEIRPGAQDQFSNVVPELQSHLHSSSSQNDQAHRSLWSAAE